MGTFAGGIKSVRDQIKNNTTYILRDDVNPADALIERRFRGGVKSFVFRA